MATLRPINEEFSDSNGNRYSNEQNGIINPRVIRGDRRNQGEVDNRRLSARGRRLEPITSSVPTELAEDIQEDRSVPVERRNKPHRGVDQTLKATLRNAAIKARAGTIAGTISLWAAPYYFFIILPLAVLADAAFMMAIVLAYVSGGGIETVAADIIGVNFSGFLAIYFALCGILLFFQIIAIGAASIQFKVAFIKPVFGHGATFKICSIMLIIIGCFIPLLKILPLLWIWLLVVILNAKKRDKTTVIN